MARAFPKPSSRDRKPPFHAHCEFGGSDGRGQSARFIAGLVIAVVAIGPLRTALAGWPESHEQEGFRLLFAGRTQEALTEFTKAIEVGDGEARLYYSRGFAWHRIGQFDQAISDFSEAISRDTRRGTYYLARALAWSVKREWAKAVQDATECIMLTSRLSDPYTVRGYAEIHLGQYAKAQEDYGTAMRISPENPNNSRMLAYLLAASPLPRLRDGAKAVHYATRACELNGWRDAWDLTILAAAYAENGDFDNAVLWQQKAIHLTPAEGRRSMQNLVQLYLDGKPYRLPSAAPEEAPAELQNAPPGLGKQEGRGGN
jgi:tetratricopeptide (TPR) repeat protein